MEQISPFKDGIQFAFDATTIKLVEECHYKYKLRILDKWIPKRRSVHLLFGGWFATALEHYYKFRAEGIASNAALCAVVREALILTWEYDFAELSVGVVPPDDLPKIETVDGKIQHAIPGTGKPWESDHPVKTRENLIRTIIWYVDEFENDASVQVVRLADGRAAVEHSFALPVDNNLVFCGHIDRLVEYGGDKYVMDQKTSQNTIGPMFFNQFTPDTQISMYSFAGKVIYNTPVKGVIIDGVQIAVGFTRFLRGFAFRSASQLDEWYENTLRLIEEVQENTRRGHFPQRTTSCNLYGGCEFRSVCSRSPEVRKNFLEADFVQAPQWNPLEVR